MYKYISYDMFIRIYVYIHMCYREAHNYPQSTAAFFRDAGHQGIGWTQNSQVSQQIIGSSIHEGTFTPFLDTTKSRPKDLELKFKHSCFVRNEYVISKSTLSKKHSPQPPGIVNLLQTRHLVVPKLCVPQWILKLLYFSTCEHSLWKCIHSHNQY